MEGWKYINLGDIIHIKHGYGFKGKYFVEEPNRNLLLTPGNFAIGGGFKSGKMKYYDGPINDEFVLCPGDVIVTMTDLSMKADTLGYSAKIPNNPENTYLHNQRLGLVSLKTNEFDLDYIYWLLRTYNYQKYIAGSSSGATVKHTSPKKIYSAKLLVPESKVTQKRIADILSAYDDLIENNLKRIKLLEQAAQNIYKEWFVNMRFPGHENTPINKETGLPVGWVKVLAKDYFYFKRGIEVGSKNYVREESENTIPFLRVGSLGSRDTDIFTDISLVKDKILKFTDVAVSMDGSIGLVGYGLVGAYSTGLRKVVPKSDKYGEGFIYCLLKSEDIQDTIRAYAKGSTILHASSSIDHLNFNNAPSGIANQFNSIIEPVYSKMLNLNKQNLNLKSARDIILPRLMNRTIEV